MQVTGPQVSWEEFDDEFVVLDLDKGLYYSFVGGAALIWRGLLAGCSPADLAAELAPQGPQAQAFEACVAGIVAAGLMAADPAPPEAAGARSQAIAAAEGDFSMEAFDDLAAVLVADPIHDVEAEAGWPHRPA